MNNNEKLSKITQAMADKAVKDQSGKEVILTEYKDKEKVKPLTTAERIDRIERLLGIV